MAFADHLERELGNLRSAGLLRARSTGGVPPAGLDVCSNDYLGYGRSPVSRETAARAGAGASRLILGTQPEHSELERELAAWVCTDDALLFSSGYAANLGALTALVRPGDLVVSDRLNHASIVDGCRLSRANIQIIPHRDLKAADAALRLPTPGQRWVVTESYFSMDGDSPDLASLRTLCDGHGAALIVDEAHALGVFGPEGAGLCRAAGIAPDVFIGGLGKAIGVQGAFVAGAATLTHLLWNRARSFVFSTATSPLLAAAALGRVRAARQDDAARLRLGERCGQLAAALLSQHQRFPAGRHGPIFPLLLGTPERATAAAQSLQSLGFLAQAIRPPTVPPGESRIRVALHADLTSADVARLATALLSVCPGS